MVYPPAKHCQSIQDPDSGKINSFRPRTRRQALASSSGRAKVRTDFAPADRRQIFAAQARLLAARAERGLPVDVRSLQNLAAIFFGEAAA
jgi:hypothetical protein